MAAPAPAPATNEVFIGALPRQTRLQAAIATGLHEALLQFAGTTDRASVQLRMHSSSDGRGLGIAFAWLPDAETAKRLVDAAELYFELNGKRVRAGIRAARGRADARAPPSSEPGRVQLSIAVFASFECKWLVAGFDAWRQRLHTHGAGLELQLLRPAGGAAACARRRRDVLTRMHAHAPHTCTRLRHAAARVPCRPASLRAAILRVRHAGDACDFTPLERLHCDLIVMLWRQVRGRGTVWVPVTAGGQP